MTSSLPASTQHRLRKLPQVASVWEGDRRPFSGDYGMETEEAGECILWVDGTEGLVRSMDVIPETAGIETVVRTLIRAMELPRSPALPCRPKQIIVRNRELQFLLRGVLQDLDIKVEYQPHLPLIDELFRAFENFDDHRPNPLPADYAKPLKELVKKIWRVAPWDVLADLDIIRLDVPTEEGEHSLYACIMGMLGEEYGIILYRSLESLQKFRQMAVTEDNVHDLEQAFLSQDCWFLNYELDDDHERQPIQQFTSAPEAVFGSIHPLEGIRPFIDESEALIIYRALEALVTFVDKHDSDLEMEEVPAIQEKIRVKHPLEPRNKSQEVRVQASTLPELAAEFIAQMDLDDEDDDEDYDDYDDEETAVPAFTDDLIPDNAYMSFGMVPWERVEIIRAYLGVCQQRAEFPEKGDGMPILMVQTTRTKAKDLVRRIQEEGGIAGLGFSIGEDPWTDTKYELGVLMTGSRKLFLFGEFLQDSNSHSQVRANWERRCKNTKGHCGVLVAMGVTGKSKGAPDYNQMMGYFETKFLTSQELGLGQLRLTPRVDFDL